MVASLILATNGIPWDETPLEHSIAALPLGLGLLLELPLLIPLTILTSNGSGAGLISYDWHSTTMQVMPFVAGACYSGLFFLIAHFTQRTAEKPNKTGAKD